MKKLFRAAVVAAAVSVSLAGALEVFAQTEIRYCCTPQQVAACSAQGGTTSCRTNLCRCLF